MSGKPVEVKACAHKNRTERAGLTECADCGKVVVIDLMLVLKSKLEAMRAGR